MIFIRIITIVLISVINLQFANANIIRVDANRLLQCSQIVPCDGTTWARAYLHLQDALDVAVSGDHIWVAAGVYKPNTLPIDAFVFPQYNLTERNYTFHLINGVELYGGFSGDESNLSDRDINENETVLSGDLGVIDAHGDNSFHVVLSINDNGSTILDGFTIEGGSVSGFDYLSRAEGENIINHAGSALYIQSSATQVRNCKFQNNIANYYGGTDGGALFVKDCITPFYQSLDFTNNSGRCIVVNNTIWFRLWETTFTNNSASSLYNYMSWSTMSQTEHRNNSTEGQDLIFSNGRLDLYNSLISGNTTQSGGSVIRAYCSTCNFSIWNTTISENGHSNIVSNIGATRIVNSIIWPIQNTGLTNQNSGFIEISNSIIDDGNENGIVEMPAGVSDLGNNSDANPLFINPVPTYPSVLGDLRLSLSSPAIDAGDNMYTPDNVDLAGNTRVQNSTIDLGCYESSLCVQPDYLALISLYNQTDGDNWTVNTNWIQNCDPCNWFGITCNADGRVISIDLQVNNLVGALPVELSQLEFLKQLKLGVNQLSGVIPSQLGQLQHLQNLWLHYNNFENQRLPVFSTPSNSVVLPSIQRMYYYGNNFIGSIPFEYGNLSTLEVLRTFDNQNLSGCYNISLSKLCSQLTDNLNTDISDGTSLKTEWEEFCSCSAGICPCDTNKWKIGSGSWDSVNKWTKDEVPTPCQEVRLDANGGDDVLIPAHYSSIIYTLDVRLGAQLEIPATSEILILTDATTKCNTSN